MNKRPLIEICAPSPERAREAFALGADRVELCREIEVGGVTPLDDELKEIPTLGGPVNVLIRCRAGNFVYTESEIRTMLDSITLAASCGASGAVVGALTEDGRIDVATSRRLIAAARSHGLSVTFHRAIDDAADYFAAYETVRGLGVDRILTSGGMETAFEGRERLAALIRRGDGPVILPGKGVTGDNVRALIASTGASEVHGTRFEILKSFK